jgi:hypothetical protein
MWRSTERARVDRVAAAVDAWPPPLVAEIGDVRRFENPAS